MTGVLRYEEPMCRFRFLLSDGRVVDVDSARDDSRLRGWLLAELGARKIDGLCIVGAAEMPAQETLELGGSA